MEKIKSGNEYSLATKYRSTNLEEVIGNDSAKEILNGMFARKKVNNTILLHGGTGMGKCVVGSTLVRTSKGMIEIEKLVKEQDDFSEYDGPSVANAFGHFVIPEAGFRKKTNKIVTVSTVYANFSGTPEHPMLAIKSGKLGFFRLDSLSTGDALIRAKIPQFIDSTEPEKDRSKKLGSILLDAKMSEDKTNFINMVDVEWLNNPSNAYQFILHLLDYAYVEYGTSISLDFANEENAKFVKRLLMNWNIRSIIDDNSISVIDDLYYLQTFFAKYFGAKPYQFECRYIGNFALIEGDNFSQDQYEQLCIVSEACQIISVTESKYPEGIYVYDLSMGQSKTFQTECYVSHNTTMARIIARYVNCENGNSCGKCPSCKLGDKSPDVIEMNMATDRGIDDARTLILKSKIAPRFNKRIFILDELHQITPQAREALLKPLEEPPNDTIWILCTTEPEKLTKTILGRCLQIKVTPPTKKEMVSFLKKISREEGVKITEERLPALKYIAESSMGHTRNALQMLEAFVNIVTAKPKITSIELEKMLVVSTGGDLDEQTAKLTAAILSGKGQEAIKILYDADKSKEIFQLMLKMRNFLDYKLNVWSGTYKFQTNVSKIFDATYKKELNVEHVIKVLNTVSECEIQLKTVPGLDERIYFSSKILNDMVSIYNSK